MTKYVGTMIFRQSYVNFIPLRLFSLSRINIVTFLVQVIWELINRDWNAHFYNIVPQKLMLMH